MNASQPETTPSPFRQRLWSYRMGRHCDLMGGCASRRGGSVNVWLEGLFIDD